MSFCHPRNLLSSTKLRQIDKRLMAMTKKVEK